ncbi:HET-domain-containing protein [Daldinia vernicosa]|uniref:HET-domain-containing protein n=1 Tax=Daldinia vernicosa TaxID=114800 RepID=UPI002008098C|nr:HET-domain-containing protein [Daldinia vernicosa]KAI0853904.1 HET-domain-containing protein [Daldinia vernicosa]
MTTTLPPLAHLCQRCSVLEFYDSDVPRALGEHPGLFRLKLDYFLLDSLPDLPCLAESAYNGCDFCSILKNAILKYSRGSFDQVLAYVFYQWRRPGEGEGGPAMKLQSLVAELLWIGYDENGDHLSLSTWLRFDIDSPPGPCSQWLGLQPPPWDKALCTDNLEMIFNSFECSNPIRTSLNGATYPTRLIDVGVKGSYSCRLVETRLDPIFMQSSDIQYATLSYCWGSPEQSSRQFKTETSSLQERICGFSFNQASPILQDAIRVTQTLGIRYLWVDAVCIIQDDKQDWYRESSQMSLIFQNSTLTICTPASTSCQEGFLSRDWTMTRIKFQSRMNEAVSGSYTIRLVGEMNNYYHATVDGLSFALTYSHWAMRGWILQEYELSQRALIFTRTKLHVITEHGVQSEGNETLDMSECTRGTVFLPGNRNKLNRYLNFLSLVESYSTMKLTHRSDKFPAISGLASRLFSGGAYYAGHVLPHIDLFWTSVLRQPAALVSREALVENLKSQNPYVAPSWSWASRNHPVNFGDGQLRIVSQESDFLDVRAECRVVHAKTSITGVDLFGGIETGELTLHGAVIPLIGHVQLLTSINGNEKLCRLVEDGEYIADLSFDWNDIYGGEAFQDLSLVLIGSRKVEGLCWEPIRLIYEHELVDKPEKKLGKDIGTTMATTKTTPMAVFVVRGRPNVASLHGKRVVHRVHYHRGHDHDKDWFQDHAAGSMDDKMVDTEMEYQRHVSEVYHGHRRPAQPSDDDQRHAYGIIVQPAPEPGKYFRVGVFLSVPRERGGLKYFRGRAMRTVEII